VHIGRANDTANRLKKYIAAK